MAYYLGVDLGTTFTAAATWRDGRAEVCSLGNRAPAVPSVVLLRGDAEVLTGEAAERRGASEPQRMAREFKRRLGDPTPIIVGGTPYSADALTSKLLRWVVGKVSELEGGPPAGITLCHPANWGDFKKDLLRQAVELADLDEVTTITEPEAAAIHYASQERVEPGAVVAVYDLGGGTFDAAVLRKADGGWDILGQPQGVERLGGVDFDEVVFQQVASVVGEPLAQLDPEDPTARAALVRLRRECVDAKEALSSDVDVSIPVLLPNLQTEVRLTRQEFEAMIRPRLVDSIEALQRALRLAGVEPGDVTAVLLVGGSSRIPLVAQLVGSELDRPVAVDAHPKYGIALGAAMIAAESALGSAAITQEVSEVTEPGIPSALIMPPPAGGGGNGGGGAKPPEAARAYVPPPDGSPATDAGGGTGELPPAGRDDRDGRSKPPWALIGGGVLLLALLVAAFLLLNGDGDEGGGDGGGAETAGDGGPAGASEGVSQSETTTTASTTAPTTTPTTASPPSYPEPYIEIQEVTNDGAYFTAQYATHGFTPSFAEGELHIHFFLRSGTEPWNAGGNGEPPGDWQLTDEPSEVTLTDPGVTVADADPAGDQLCAVVADTGHNVADRERELDEATRSGNCVSAL